MPKQPLPTPAAFADKPYAHIPMVQVESNQVATPAPTAAPAPVEQQMEWPFPVSTVYPRGSTA